MLGKKKKDFINAIKGYMKVGINWKYISYSASIQSIKPKFKTKLQTTYVFTGSLTPFEEGSAPVKWSCNADRIGKTLLSWITLGGNLFKNWFVVNRWLGGSLVYP